VPTAGFTALQGLRDKGGIQPGQHVLIHGAGGGVGTFAVQIAKALGAEVTAVSSTRTVDLLRSIGADHVIDYTREDFTRGATRYDLMLDIGADRPLSDCRRILTPHGRVVMVGPGRGDWIGPVTRILRATATSRFGRQKVLAFLATDDHADLVVLRDMLEAGSIKPVICRSFPLSRAPEAIRHVEDGHAQGKVVVTV
jgi:NADPH:quinone reductase-like Zn-dependent oxidoreductase